MDELEDAVNKFSNRMLRKLRMNQHKGNAAGWRNTTFSNLLKMLKDEIVELEVELLDQEDYDFIIDECANVANFAMMIADNAQCRSDCLLSS